MKTSRRTIAAVTILLASLSCAAKWAQSQSQTQTVPISSPKGVAASLLPLINDQTIAGAVTVVATQDRVISSETVGYADVAAKRAMRTDDLFWIASMSKSMTATALLMLVDQGKVNVDDPVEKYLPEFQGQMLAVKQDQEKPVLKKPAAHPITVREILSHTSGLPPRTEVEQPTLDTLPLRDAVLSYARTALQFEPGSRYQYSNAGINTAGRIIEVVSGVPYEEFMDRRLFDPLGMKDTTFWPDAAQLERLACSYLPAKGKAGLEETPIGQLRYPLSDRTRYPMPAGGLFSTAADVTRFCQMILSGGVWNGTRYLSEDAVRQMTSSQIGDVVIKGNPGIGYGFGWQVTGKSAGPPDAFGAGTFGHGGAYKTDMKIDPRQKLIVVVMMQLAGPQGIGGPSRTALARAANAAFAADNAAAQMNMSNPTRLDDPHHLSRFVAAQQDDYERALSEIRSGRKRSHWMWYIFPQLDGLAFSSTAEHYAIKSLDEARAYLAHPLLGPRLLECAQAVVAVEGRRAAEIFGSPDDLKLRSCATLFACVSPPGSVFHGLIEKYYAGEPDGKTLRLSGIDRL